MTSVEAEGTTVADGPRFPKIIVFCCNWCSYAGADLAGVSRLQMPTDFGVIRVMCSGRVDPEHILKAFSIGADGILVAGCHPADCHYIGGNYRTRRRIPLLQIMLEQFGLADRRRHKPKELSGGERQRVAIARALMNRPKLLLADEPTGNLDRKTGLKIMEILRDIHEKGNQTVVMVTHDQTLAEQSDRVLHLEDGRLSR